MPKRKMPVKTVTLDFTKDGYGGFVADAWINAPVAFTREVLSLDKDASEKGARKLFLAMFPSWRGFVDYRGQDIPHTEAGCDYIPSDLMEIMYVRRIAAIKKRVMPTPLGNDSSTTPSPDTTDSPTPPEGSESGQDTPSGR